MFDRSFALRQVKMHGKRRVLGILDIYGFENLPENGFEQLIINYCNEKLHQHVNEVTLKEEQEDNVHEGLEWSAIPFVDNTPVCDLFDKVRLRTRQWREKDRLLTCFACSETPVQFELALAARRGMPARGSRIGRLVREQTRPGVPRQPIAGNHDRAGFQVR